MIYFQCIIPIPWYIDHDSHRQFQGRIGPVAIQTLGSTAKPLSCGLDQLTTWTNTSIDIQTEQIGIGKILQKKVVQFWGGQRSICCWIAEFAHVLNKRSKSELGPVDGHGHSDKWKEDCWIMLNPQNWSWNRVLGPLKFNPYNFGSLVSNFAVLEFERQLSA